MLQDFELGEGAVINDFGVHEVGAGPLLKGRKLIVVVDCITNCRTAARECMCNVLMQFIP